MDYHFIASDGSDVLVTVDDDGSVDITYQPDIVYTDPDTDT